MKLSDTDQPELIFVSADRKGIITEQNVDGAPDLIVADLEALFAF